MTVSPREKPQNKVRLMKTLVELLAPAGSREALLAAVESGANAVYLAGRMFGARAYAANFDEEGLREAVRLAHLRNVLINVTVNTIVADEEIPELKKYLRFLADAGVDAVLVQDLGVAKIARETVPELPLHASTQMTVHSLAGVLELQRLGFARVVLARELSLKEIRAICRQSEAEIEVFMHGALCVCYSGQCLMSSMIGGRSGNRGRCAQPCRLPYTLVEQAEPEQDVLGDKAGEYLLSPRDLNTLDLIPDLIEAGVASLKIEGRMKRPEYVATVVSTYRGVIDRYCSGGETRPTRQEYDRLAQIFNRDFTTAYLAGRPGKLMMSDRRPNNRGLLVGRVVSYDKSGRRVTVKLSGSLSPGDQVDFWVKVGGRVTAAPKEIWVGRQKVPKAEAGMTVSFDLPGTVREHDRVFKVYDAKLMEEARQSYNSGAPVRRIGLKAEVRVRAGEPLTMRFTDADGHRAEKQTAFIAETALKRPLTEETVRKQVERLGASVFELTELSCDIRGEVMVPMSELNETRRQAVEELERQRLAEFLRFRPVSGAGLPSWPQREKKKLRPAELMVSVDDLEKMQAALEGGADGILFGGESYEHHALGNEDYRRAGELAEKYGARLDFNTPRILSMAAQPSVEALLDAWADCPPAAVHVHNIGTLALVRERSGLPIHADYSLISYNSETLAALQGLGASEATLSPELNLQQVRKITQISPLPLSCLVHGRLELMVSEYCVAGSFLGNAGEGRTCRRPCREKRYALKDRKQALFPLAMDQYCRMHVLNSKVLSMLPHAAKLRLAGIQTLRIEAKALKTAEITRLTKAYREALSWDDDPDEARQSWAEQQEGPDITRGHYFRGVM